MQAALRVTVTDALQSVAVDRRQGQFFSINRKTSGRLRPKIFMFRAV
jgi:hypothetical protein